jgi:hypothetical protein
MEDALIQNQGLGDETWLRELNVRIPAFPRLASISCQVALIKKILGKGLMEPEIVERTPWDGQ